GGDASTSDDNQDDGGSIESRDLAREQFKANQYEHIEEIVLSFMEEETDSPEIFADIDPKEAIIAAATVLARIAPQPAGDGHSVEVVESDENHTERNTRISQQKITRSVK